jgi:hypothetical protein
MKSGDVKRWLSPLNVLFFQFLSGIQASADWHRKFNSLHVVNQPGNLAGGQNE